MKNCLIIYYSQSGQAFNIARAVTEPLKSEFHLHFEELKPVTSFPFPWKGMSFFQAFPESVKEIPCPMEPFGFSTDVKYDLVVLAYPVWYLSPPIPLSSFLQSEAGRKVLKDTPVITLLGVRNMWAMAQQRVQEFIHQNGGRLVGNIVMSDPNPNLVSVITIVRWMMTADRHGKGLYAKIFPPAGVPDQAIGNASRFGETILEACRNEQLDGLQDKLVEQGAVKVDPVLVNIEKRAKKMFGILASWILKKGGYNSPYRICRLKFFKYYLFTVIYLVSPFASIVFRIAGKLNPRASGKIIARHSGVK
jgi:hypothetical protein